MHKTLTRLAALTRWLSIPLVLLLFMQWPLREWLHAYSREANDIAQWISRFMSAWLSAWPRALSRI
jgi:hypothetical protein